jgi:predicted DCC family thiol-disulfide oxidoreductase YuxK
LAQLGGLPVRKEADIGISMPAPLTTVFYDGHCGLCHGFVRFLLARDPGGGIFDFAPLQGRFFAMAIPDCKRAGLPDSVVVRTDDGQVVVKSAAVLYLLKRLGGVWCFFAAVLGVFPRGLLDCAYDANAKIRRLLFPQPPGVCPVIPPHLRARFHL